MIYSVPLAVISPANSTWLAKYRLPVRSLATKPVMRSCRFHVAKWYASAEHRVQGIHPAGPRLSFTA